MQDLIEIGFSPEQSALALKATQNKKEEAIELLCSAGSDLETLRALVGMAKVEGQDEEDMWEDEDEKPFNTKMNIVVRTDKAVNEELSP